MTERCCLLCSLGQVLNGKINLQLGDRNMWRHASALIILWVCSPWLAAQSGTAPSGYYPPTYNGSIFTGTLQAVDTNTQEITLVYTKGKKSELFVGRMESFCRWKEKGGAVHSFKASDIPKGTVLTAFYNTFIKKSDGQASKENSVFAISYVELNGKKIAAEKRLAIACSDRTVNFFKVF